MNVGSGVLMIGVGVLFITGRISDISSWITNVFVRFGWDRLAEI